MGLARNLKEIGNHAPQDALVPVLSVNVRGFNYFIPLKCSASESATVLPNLEAVRNLLFRKKGINCIPSAAPEVACCHSLCDAVAL